MKTIEQTRYLRMSNKKQPIRSGTVILKTETNEKHTEQAGRDEYTV